MATSKYDAKSQQDRDDDKGKMRSKYQIASIGIVVETKPNGTDIVLASPVEIFYDQPSGRIYDKKEEFEGGKGEINRENLQTEHEAKNYVRARWRPIGSNNRVTPPDVYEGERVLLFNYEGTEEWYWDNLGNEPSLRGLEDVVYLFSNVSGQGSYALSNSYFVRYNTKDKFIHLHTSKSDGEACEYDFKIDTKSGIWSMVDDLGNTLTMNSVDGTFVGQINELFNIKTKTIHFECEDIITDTKTSTLNASSKSDVNTPLETISDKVKIGDTLDVGSHTTIGGNIVVAGSITTGGGAVRAMPLLGKTVSSQPSSRLAGNKTRRGGGAGSGGTITGDLVLNGNLHVTGSGTFGGTLKVSGTITCSYIDAPNVK